MDKREKVRCILHYNQLDKFAKESVGLILEIAEKYWHPETCQFFRQRRETIEIMFQQKLEDLFANTVSEADLDTLIAAQECEAAQRFNAAIPKVKKRLLDASLEILQNILRDQNPPK